MNFITLSGILKNKKYNNMGAIIRKIFTWLILPVGIIVITYFLVQGIMEPVKFNEEMDSRKAVAVQRLKDIRDIQIIYKNVNGKYVSTIDSLKNFYLNGKIKINMQVGSKDDSLAMVNTEKIKKQYRNLKGEALNQKLYELYQNGEKNLVFAVKSEVAVKDSLFKGRTDFNVDSLGFIPFSGEPVQMAAVTNSVQGVQVPLFEAKMPYEALLNGMNKQLLVNLKAKNEKESKYHGLMVGSIDAPNNNAGNWE